MFIGFIPFLVAAGAAALSLRDERRARLAWGLACALLVAWTVFHGAHHAAGLAKIAAW